MNGNLLVVDDSSINRELLGEMLRGAGYRVRVAGSGAEALEAVRREPPAPPAPVPPPAAPPPPPVPAPPAPPKDRWRSSGPLYLFGAAALPAFPASSPSPFSTRS